MGHCYALAAKLGKKPEFHPVFITQYNIVLDLGELLNFETDFLFLMIPLIKRVRLDTSIFFIFLRY